MIIDCAHYQDGHRTDEGPVPWEEAVARISQGGFVWLGLFEPSPDELDQVRDTFGLHPLAVEDAQILHRRPKIETYEGDVLLVIVRTRPLRRGHRRGCVRPERIPGRSREIRCNQVVLNSV